MDYGYRYNYDYDQYYPVRNSSNTVAEAVLAIYLVILALIVIFALVSYIFHSIGLYTIGKRMGKEYPWLAFIPYARDYFQGELAGEITLKNKKIKNPGIWNLVIPIISSVLAGIFLVIILLVAGVGAAAEAAGFGGLGAAAVLAIMLYTVLIVAVVVLNAAQMVLKVLINKQILERFTTENMGTVHAVLSIAVPLYEAFCFFVMRGRDFNPGMEPKITPPPAPVPPVYPGGPVPPVSPEMPIPPENTNTEPAHGAEMPAAASQSIAPEETAAAPQPIAPEETAVTARTESPEGVTTADQSVSPETADPQASDESGGRTDESEKTE